MSDNVLSALNLAMNILTICTLIYMIRERRQWTRRRQGEAVALMQKSRRVYQLGMVEGESRVVQSLVDNLRAGASLDQWMATEVRRVDERRHEFQEDRGLLEGVV